MKRKAIIVDLDGTLCDCTHRRHHVEAGDWDAFYAGIPQDPINLWCHALIEAMNEIGYEVLFVSGRPEKYRQDTENWLVNIGFGHGEFTEEYLFMRPNGDSRKDSIIKTEIYLNKIKPNYDVIFCVDDRKQVVDAWRELGLTCLQCAEGNF